MESLYGSFTQTDYDNLMLEYHALMDEQIEKGIDHSERLAKLHKILWEDEDMSFEDLAKFNKRETMIILAQSKETDGACAIFKFILYWNDEARILFARKTHF